MRQLRRFYPREVEVLEGRTVPSGIAAAAVGDPASLLPVERPDTVGIHAGFVSVADSGGASDVVLYGDSITGIYGQRLIEDVASWGSELAPFQVASFGVGGDHLENLLWRLENGELDGQPRVAVVLIGTNNIDLATPDAIAAGIGTVVATIRTLSPQTQILLLDLLPRGTPDDPVRPVLQQVNAEIAGLADGTFVHVLNFDTLFLLPDGSIPPDLMESDYLLHPTGVGSELIADALLAPIDSILGVAWPDPTLYGGPVLINVPSDVVEEASASGTAVLSVPPPTAVDALDPSPTVTLDPPIGTPLPVGTTVVTCRAINRFGRSCLTSFIVTVKPDNPPVFQHVPSDMVVEATTPQGAVISFRPTATDSFGSIVNVSTMPPSGSTFPLGTTRVVCTATDQVGNVVMATFSVTVNDIPVFRDDPASIVVEVPSPRGAVVKYRPPTAESIAGGDLLVVSTTASGSTFPIGTTRITFTAKGLTGLSRSTSFTITVVARGNVASVSGLVRTIFHREVAPSPRIRSTQAQSNRAATAMNYSPSDPKHNVSGAAAVSFLSRVDADHDFRVSRKELTRFLSASVDLDHDGEISRYEVALLQLHDPEAARFLFPSS